MNEQERHIDVWNHCLSILEQIVEPQPFETWFKPVSPVSLVGKNLTVEVPSDFFRQYLEESFINEIRLTLKRVLGSDARLYYTVKPVSTQPNMTFPSQPGATPENRPVPMSDFPQMVNASPFAYPGIKPVVIDPRLNPVNCFANFVVGECNKLGITAGTSIASSPGKTPFNPLFIFSAPGLGKTHLSQAIGISIHEKYPNLIVLYVSGSEFKNQYVRAVTVQNKLSDFIAYYSRIDVLIVDDIQDLMGPGCQNAFFSIFNHLHLNGKQLILTSDRPAIELQNFEERLSSRLKWGLSVQLHHPDYQTRLKMLRARAERDGISLGDDVIEYIATNVKTNFRELEGALVSIMAYITASPQRSAMDVATEVISKLVGKVSTEMSVEKVRNTVCEYFNITSEDIASKCRKRQIVQARQIAMYLCRSLLSNCSLSTIGAEIGGKDHATVLHACTTVSDLMTTDKCFKKYVSDIEQLLAPEL